MGKLTANDDHAMTPEQLARYEQLKAELAGRSSFLEPLPSPSAGPSMGSGERIARTAGNLPSYWANMGAEFGNSLISGLSGERGAPETHVAPTFDVPAPKTAGDVAIDIGGVLAGELPLLVSGAGAGRRLLGGGKAAAVAGDTAMGVLSGSRQSAGESAIQGAEFGLGSSIAQLLASRSPVARALLGAGTNAAIGLGGQVARGNDPLSQSSLTQAAIMSALPVAQEAVGATGRRLLRRASDTPTVSDAPTAPQLAPEVPDYKVLESIENADGGFTNTIQADGGGTQTFRSEIAYPVTAPKRKLAPIAADDLSVAPELAADDVFANAQRRQPLLREAIAPDATVPPPLEAEAGAAPSIVTPETPSQPRALRPLAKSQSGATSTPLVQNLAAGTVGGLAGGYFDEDNRARGALMGATAGIGLLRGSKALSNIGPKMEQAAREHMRGEKNLLGGFRRMFERNFNAGKDERLKTIFEQAGGETRDKLGQAGAVIKEITGDVSNLDPVKRAHAEAFLRSDRSSAAQALLNASPVPDKVKQGLLKLTALKEELQQIVARGERDPSKIKLINDTVGSWQTQQYRAYLQPKKWKAEKGLIDRVVQERMGGRIMANSDEALVRQDVNDWLKEVANSGGDFAKMQNEGKSRISQSLFKERRELSPSVKKILGEVTDPFEREILSVAKLAKSTVTAKAISDLMKLPDSKGARFAMTESEWKDAYDKASAAGDKAKIFELEGYTRAPSGPGMGGLGEVPNLKNGQAMFVQRQVLDALKAGPGHGGVDWEQGMLGFMAKLNKVPKAVNTLYNPGTWAKNYAQTALQAASVGMSPVALTKNYRKLKSNPSWMKMASEDGILDAHMGAAEFNGPDALEKSLKPWYRRPFGAVNDKIKQGYGKPDQWVRGAAYVKFLEEGLERKMPMDEARRHAVTMTNRYTHNYGNVAPAVGVARNIPVFSPFLTYTAEMARIVKNLAHDVVTNENGRRIPSTLGLLSLFGIGGIAKSAFSEMNLDEDGKKAFNEILELLPASMRSKISAPVSYDKKTGRMEMRNLAPWLPAGDFTVFAKNLLSGDFEAIAERNPVASLQSSPGLNMVAELVTGRDIYSGKENEGIERYTRPLLKQALPSYAPGNYRWNQMKDAFTPNDEGGLGITNPSTGRRETPKNALRGLLLGDSVMEVSKESLIKKQVREIDAELSTARRLLRKVTDTNAAPSVKEKAVRQYEEKERRILLKRQEALGKLQ